MPTLKSFATLWTLTDHPGSLEEKVARIRAAHFDGVGGHALPEIGDAARRHGLAFIAYVVLDADNYKQVLHAASNLGAVRVNAFYGAHDTPPDAAAETLVRVFAEADSLGIALDLETHRATSTETPEKISRIAARFQQLASTPLRFCQDMSHAAVVKHLFPHEYAARLMPAGSLAAVRQMHLRPFNGQHCQIPATDGTGAATRSFLGWLEFTTNLLAQWQSEVPADAELWWCPELGPVSSGYALEAFPDVWSDAMFVRRAVMAKHDDPPRNWELWMARRTRGNRRLEFTAKVGLVAVRGDKTLAELARPLRALSLFCFALVALIFIAPCAKAVSAQDVAPAEAVLRRVAPHLASQFDLRLEERNGGDYFHIDGTPGHIRVRAATIPSLLFGVNWYLKTVAHLHISPNGHQLETSTPRLPAPKAAIDMPALYPWRYALNENTDGYATPYWDEARWQREIDILALSGVNAVLVERGMDMVLYQTFLEAGYEDASIRAWIVQPAHQNWQLMGNMCCFNGPISLELLKKRAESAKRIVAMLRELGITPVFQGYYGMVPADFVSHHPDAHVVAQGEWCGFTRPGWLDPRDAWFAKISEAFYRHQRELYGDGKIYDMEIFQEGGSAGDVPVRAAVVAVQQALLRAHPDALWMQMAWQENPSDELLSAVDPKHFMVVDIEQGRIARPHRDEQFRGAPWLFGGLWEFGGRTTLGAPLHDYAVRLPQMAGKTGSGIAGIGYFTEGLDTNPVAFDLYTEMAWRKGPVDLESWIDDYAVRRYGARDMHAQRAWRILLHSAYGYRADKIPVTDAGERDAAHESLFAAQPSLTTQRASSWAPTGMRYDGRKLQQALDELLVVAPALRRKEAYQFDLVDVARQVVANESRRLLPLIRQAYESRNKVAFRALTQEWMRDMQLQDNLLRTNKFFLLGAWLDRVPAWASSEEELARLEYDARSILTIWGERKASEEGGLHDYANRDWAGLISDYYMPRWQRYFSALQHSLDTKLPPEPIDWYAMGEAWSRSRKTYDRDASGDAYLEARAIGSAVKESRLTH